MLDTDDNIFKQFLRVNNSEEGTQHSDEVCEVLYEMVWFHSVIIARSILICFVRKYI